MKKQKRLLGKSYSVQRLLKISLGHCALMASRFDVNLSEKKELVLLTQPSNAA